MAVKFDGKKTGLFAAGVLLFTASTATFRFF